MVDLPPNWERRVNQNGREYYVDHDAKITQWHPPVTATSGRWEERRNPNGRVYYVDHNTKTTTWNKPSAELLQNFADFQGNADQRMADRYGPNRLNQGSASTTPQSRALPNTGSTEIPLPANWEARTNESGTTYFVNHDTKITTYKDPRKKPLPVKKTTCDVVSFERKVGALRTRIQESSVMGQVKINVKRGQLMETSLDEVMNTDPREFRKRLFICFDGEAGLDYGGVAREWFFKLSTELLNPIYGFFEYASNNNYSLQINPASVFDPEYIKFFRFVGRFIAMAIYHGKFIDSGFTLAFYKQLLNRKLTIHDIETVDEAYYSSLTHISNAAAEDLEYLYMYFVVDYEILGETHEYELKPGGKDIQLTVDNRDEYLDLVVKWRFSRGVEDQTRAFKEGFEDIFPLSWLSDIDELQLESLICGMQEIDVNDWESNTIYRTYTKSDKQVVWFWQWVRSLCQENRVRLLQFVTGTCRIPVGGFKSLLGSNGLEKFCIEKIGDKSWLPRSHTCFNRLDLPPYESKEQLAAKLSMAIHETEGFGQE